MQQPISPAGTSDDQSGESGFTLLEVVCVVAIMALLAAVLLPTFPHGTSRARLEAYAIATAALLKADRNAALRRQRLVETRVDAVSRMIGSGATSETVHIPDDVKLTALLPARCGQARVGSSIRFFATGLSCGGVITLSHSGVSYEIRVNWLTGGVDVVPTNSS